MTLVKLLTIWLDTCRFYILLRVGSHGVPSLKAHSCQQVPTWRQSSKFLRIKSPFNYGLYEILIISCKNNFKTCCELGLTFFSRKCCHVGIHVIFGT